MADNGWDSYAKLVLAELERHNSLLNAISDKLDTINLQQALTEKETVAVKEEVAELRDTATNLDERVGTLEQKDIVSDALKKYRGWVITGAVGIVTAIIIPAAELLNKLGVFG